MHFFHAEVNTSTSGYEEVVSTKVMGTTPIEEIVGVEILSTKLLNAWCRGISTTDRVVLKLIDDTT